jgi:imidazole glycerol-phosphate synthase subunit HisH
MIAVIDYGRGNLGSVEKAFRRVGCPAVVTQDPRAVDEAQAVVLPGDGAFHDAMRNLEQLGLLPALRRALDGTRPFFGICLGYQLLFSTSEEFGEGRGLDVVPGAVRRLPPGPKIPHMGWNRVDHAGDLRLFDGIPSDARFYFVHSFYPVVAGTVSTPSIEGDPTQMQVAPDVRSTLVASPAQLRIAWCEYGIRFAAAIEVGRIYATQFHPEKSQRWGLRMLENFAAIVKDGA